MKYFEIEYIQNGQKRTTIISSSHKIEAIKHFKTLYLGVFVNIAEINEPFEYKAKRFLEDIDKYIKSKKVSLEPYIATLRHLSIMLDAGLAVTVCLQDIVKTTADKQLKEIYKDILNKVESGIGISKAFLDYKYEFGEISYAMVDLGEQTGTLSDAIAKLADILQEIYDNRIRLKKAVRYPLLTMFAMIAAFGFVIVIVVPEFQTIFKEYNTTLPYPTLILLAIERAIKNFAPLIMASIGITLLFSFYLYRNSERFRYYFDKYVLKVFIIGKVIHLSMIGRFIYVFERLTNSGIPIIDALKTSIGIVENRYLKKKMFLIIQDIESGKSLTRGFENTKEFPSMIIQMISAGETSGSLNAMLKKVSNYYMAKYINLVDNVAAMIEPLLIFAIAGFVLLLATGIFLPMWSMADAVTQ